MSEPVEPDYDAELEALENAVTVPIEDTGIGEHTATLRIAFEELDRTAMERALTIIGASLRPTTIQFSFGTGVSPPLLVTQQEAARSLAIHPQAVMRMVTYGWLRPVHYHSHLASQVVPPAVAMETDYWSGWEIRVPWEDVVELKRWSIEHRHLPTWEESAALRPGRIQRRGPTLGHQPFNTAAAVRRYLRLRTLGPDGTHQWIAVKDLYEGVGEEHSSQSIKYFTVTAAVHACVKRGEVLRRTYRATYQSGQGVQVCWIPEAKRRKVVPHEMPPKRRLEADEVKPRSSYRRLMPMAAPKDMEPDEATKEWQASSGVFTSAGPRSPAVKKEAKDKAASAVMLQQRRQRRRRKQAPKAPSEPAE